MRKIPRSYFIFFNPLNKNARIFFSSSKTTTHNASGFNRLSNEIFLSFKYKEIILLVVTEFLDGKLKQKQELSTRQKSCFSLNICKFRHKLLKTTRSFKK